MALTCDHPPHPTHTHTHTPTYTHTHHTHTQQLSGLVLLQQVLSKQQLFPRYTCTVHTMLVAVFMLIPPASDTMRPGWMGVV